MRLLVCDCASKWLWQKSAVCVKYLVRSKMIVFNLDVKSDSFPTAPLPLLHCHASLAAQPPPSHCPPPRPPAAATATTTLHRRQIRSRRRLTGRADECSNANSNDEHYATTTSLFSLVELGGFRDRNVFGRWGDGVRNPWANKGLEVAEIIDDGVSNGMLPSIESHLQG